MTPPKGAQPVITGLRKVATGLGLVFAALLISVPGSMGMCIAILFANRLSCGVSLVLPIAFVYLYASLLWGLRDALQGQARYLELKDLQR